MVAIKQLPKTQDLLIILNNKNNSLLYMVFRPAEMIKISAVTKEKARAIACLGLKDNSLITLQQINK